MKVIQYNTNGRYNKKVTRKKTQKTYKIKNHRSHNLGGMNSLQVYIGEIKKEITSS